MCGMQVIRVFHKKIHPESSIAAREFVNSHKYKVKKAPSGGYNNGDQMNLGEDNDGLTLEPMSKMGIQCCKTNLNAPRDGLHDSNLSAKEHWIMTDADCKYQFFFFWFGKLHTHPVGFESTVSPSTHTCERRKFHLSQGSLASKYQFIPVPLQNIYYKSHHI